MGYYRFNSEKYWRWHQDDGCVKGCFLSGFPQSHPEAKLGSHSHGSMKQSAIFGVTGITLEWMWLLCPVGNPSAQARHGDDNDMMVTCPRVAVQCGHSLEGAASPGVIKRMMTSSNGNIFRVIGPLCGEITGHRWISFTKASDAELWCFLWSTPK